MKKILSCTAAICLLVACQQSGNGVGVSNSQVGSIAGGVAGAAVGSQIGGGTGNVIAIVAGTLLGSALGSSVAQNMNTADVNYYDKSSQRALEVGQPGQVFPWQSPASSISGTVTPSTYYQNANGQYCRKYEQTIIIDGRAEQGQGVACRQSNGTWKIES